MTFLSRLLNKADHFFAGISAVAIFVMIVWIVANIFSRQMFGTPIGGTVEIMGEYFLVIIVYLSLSYTQQKGAHITVDFLLEKLPNVWRGMILVLVNLLAAIAFIVVGISNIDTAMEYFAKDIRSLSVLHYSLGPSILVITIGVFLLSFRLILESLLIILNGFQSKTENGTL